MSKLDCQDDFTGGFILGMATMVVIVLLIAAGGVLWIG